MQSILCMNAIIKLYKQSTLFLDSVEIRVAYKIEYSIIAVHNYNQGNIMQSK